jgi:TPR repeat protein
MKFLMFNTNKKDLQKLFDYELYKNNYNEYSRLREQININNNKDVDFAIKLLQELNSKDNYSYLFNPVENILKYFTRNQKIKQKILIYYFGQIVPVLKLMFQHVSNDTKGIILETLYCVGTQESVNLFMEFVLDINNDIDNYTSYQAIKAFVNSDQEVIKIFVSNADKLLQPNKFRTVAFIELFAQWASDGKLLYNPIQDHLWLIEEWIKDTNYENLGYAVSGCAALATVNSEESKKLLKLASEHPKLEIQLEAAFAQILLGEEKAKDKMKLLAQNPIISEAAFGYVMELIIKYGINCGFTREDVMSQVTDKEDFYAMAKMSSWCSHFCEYGISPDAIKVWAKEEIYWPPSEEKLQVYLIKYTYNNYKWCEKGGNIEHVGYYLPDSDTVFSTMESFDDIYEAYANYASWESRGEITQEQSLELIRKFTTPNKSLYELPQRVRDQGDAAAQYNLGLRYLTGDRVVKDLTKAVELFQEAADQGLADAQHVLGLCYALGDGVAKDSTKAVELFQKAADQGHEDAQCSLGLGYATGSGVATDLTKAAEWFQKAADQGHTKAQYYLGWCYAEGDGVTKDINKAVEWYKKAADHGHAEAQYYLGLCYTEGDGVTKDINKAVEWCRKAADQELAEAQFVLGKFYNIGIGVTKDSTKAVQWFKEAADQGLAEAQFYLGVCYDTGNGVTKDSAKAVGWFKKAAEQGHTMAQAALGAYYAEGIGVARDLTEAVEWYKKAADQGHAMAQAALGWCYDTGSGVARDLTKAVEWYQKAADQGNAMAQSALQRLSE